MGVTYTTVSLSNLTRSQPPYTPQVGNHNSWDPVGLIPGSN